MYNLLSITCHVACENNDRVRVETIGTYSNNMIANNNKRLFFLYCRSAMRTPYPDNGFYGARDDRKSTTSRPLGWWWRFIDNLKRNLGKKHPVSSTTAAVRNDASPPPETIVTYSIKGCSPTKMPFDLSSCSDLSRAPLHRVSTTRVIYYVPPTSQIGISDPFDFDL